MLSSPTVTSTRRKDPLMSMYLPNPDLQPTGWEIAEFLDVTTMAETPAASTAPFEPAEGAPTEPADPSESV